jgi:uncharacterized surface protein with fasciclin (FAS1) repeats
MRYQIASLLAAFLPIAAAVPVTAQSTITDIVVAASGGANAGEFDNNKHDYDLLVRAVTLAGLADDLDDPAANLTVFAPSDAAFVRLAKDLGYNGNDEAGAWSFLVGVLTVLGNNDPLPVLTNILLYHVSGSRISAVDVIVKTLRHQTIPTLLTGATIRPFFLVLKDNEPDLQNPWITSPVNLHASNGIVHGLTRVLIPVDLP